MQIPYDLEFVENRPRVPARAIALAKPLPGWNGGRRVREPDVFDALLLWAHRLIGRIENPNRHR
jgi:hypothetical protein